MSDLFDFSGFSLDNTSLEATPTLDHRDENPDLDPFPSDYLSGGESEPVLLPPIPIEQEHNILLPEVTSITEPQTANTKRKAITPAFQVRKRRANAGPPTFSSLPSSSSTSSSNLPSFSGASSSAIETITSPYNHPSEFILPIKSELDILWEACEELLASDAKVVYDKYTKMDLRRFVWLMVMKKEEIKVTRTVGI